MVYQTIDSSALAGRIEKWQDLRQQTNENAFYLGNLFRSLVCVILLQPGVICTKHVDKGKYYRTSYNAI